MSKRGLHKIRGKIRRTPYNARGARDETSSCWSPLPYVQVTFLFSSILRRLHKKILSVPVLFCGHGSIWFASHVDPRAQCYAMQRGEIRHMQGRVGVRFPVTPHPHPDIAKGEDNTSRHLTLSLPARLNTTLLYIHVDATPISSSLGPPMRQIVNFFRE